jgi:hypothetical protein
MSVSLPMFMAANWRIYTVVNAFQNVTDALRSLQSDAWAVETARKSEDAAKRSFDIVRMQLKMRPGFPDRCLYRAADLFLGVAVAGAGRSHAPRRYAGAVHGARRRLVESRAGHTTLTRAGQRIGRLQPNMARSRARLAKKWEPVFRVKRALNY